MTAKEINDMIEAGAFLAGVYFLTSAIFGYKKRKLEESRQEDINGVGAVRVKRRVYKEVSLAQDAGVDFTKKYNELTPAEQKALEHIGKDVVGWKQSKRSIESGKLYTESYYGSLRRAYNAISGVEGIGRAYNVKDAQGNVVLTWIEDAAAHVEAEQRVLEAEKRAAEARQRLAKTRRTNATTPARSPQKNTNSIRRELLDRAKHMQVAIPDEDGYRYITGDERYNYLNLINFVVMVHDSSASTNETTDYPVRSYPNEKDAADFAKAWAGKITSEKIDMSKTLIGRRSCKVYPILDVPIQKISGIGAIRAKDILEPGLMQYLRENLNSDEINETIDEIQESREPLVRVNNDLYNEIIDLVSEWCTDYGVDDQEIWNLIDPEDILWDL